MLINTKLIKIQTRNAMIYTYHLFCIDFQILTLSLLVSITFCLTNQIVLWNIKWICQCCFKHKIHVNVTGEISGDTAGLSHMMCIYLWCASPRELPLSYTRSLLYPPILSKIPPTSFGSYLTSHDLSYPKGPLGQFMSE